MKKKKHPLIFSYLKKGKKLRLVLIACEKLDDTRLLLICKVKGGNRSLKKSPVYRF